jgi:beta-glucosidase/6-phospho-beta-glucosidase/beta-galactosidase
MILRPLRVGLKFAENIIFNFSIMQIEGGYLEGKKGLSNWDVFTHKQGEA